MIELSICHVNDYLFYSFQNEARNATQILAVVAVSFGAYIYGTTVVFPAVANPSLRKSNETYWSNNQTYSSSRQQHSNESSSQLYYLSNVNCPSCNSSIEYGSAFQSNSSEAYLPFLITENDLSLVGKDNESYL